VSTIGYFTRVIVRNYVVAETHESVAKKQTLHYLQVGVEENSNVQHDPDDATHNQVYSAPQQVTHDIPEEGTDNVSESNKTAE